MPTPVYPLTVLHVLGEIRPSGMERMLASAASHLRDRGFESVALGQGMDHPFQNDLSSAGVGVEIFEEPIWEREQHPRLRNVIAEHNVQLIHIHTERRYLSTIRALRRASRGEKIPIVRTVHNIFTPPAFKYLQRVAQSAVADRSVRALVAPTEEVSDNERRFLRRVEVQANWVGSEFFEARREPPLNPTMALVGNCSNVKNHEFALTLALRLGHAVAHVGLEQAASVEEKNLLDQLARRGLLVQRGAGNPLKALSTATYFAMPSLHEGMGVALAEAIAVGLPSVVADSPGLRWAKDFSGVNVVPLDVDLWVDALSSAATMETPIKGADTLSSQSGAERYAEVYRRAVRQSQ